MQNTMRFKEKYSAEVRKDYYERLKQQCDTKIPVIIETHVQSKLKFFSQM